MPMYDFLCRESGCEAEFEAYRPVGTSSTPCPECGSPAEKVWISHPPSVIGDECDIIQENGFPQPVRFTSMSERRRALKEAGMEEMVRHTGVPGTDRSPHTSNWAAIGKDTLESARLMLERVGRKVVVEPSDDEVDDAFLAGEISVPAPVPMPSGRNINLRIGKVYSGVIDPKDM